MPTGGYKCHIYSKIYLSAHDDMNNLVGYNKWYPAATADNICYMWMANEQSRYKTSYTMILDLWDELTMIDWVVMKADELSYFHNCSQTLEHPHSTKDKSRGTKIPILA